MADDKEKKPSSGGTRRSSPRERKRRIEARDLSPTPEETPQADESSSDVEEVEVPQPEEAAPVPDPVPEESAAPPPPPVRPPRRKPAAERFPPIPVEKPAASRAKQSVRQQPAAAPRRRGFGCRDVVAFLFALAALVAAGYFIYIWNNPYSPLNPLSPPVPPPVVVSETPLPTATFTATATSTTRPTATFTPLPAEAIVATATLDPQFTPDLTLTLLAGTPSATPPPPPFALIRSGIVRMSNAGTEGCDYLGIAGSVVDFDGKALNGYVIWITGEDIDERLISGSNNTYGAGGFLLPVGTEPEIKPFAVLLLAPDGVTEVSEPYTFLTSNICEYNVTVLRFVQVEDF
ncbi:MAG: hypothetical protein IT320_13355 [Anaerolineae bacterium]|nr:hypothetical protein [Anaerolineae bacterium]